MTIRNIKAHERYPPGRQYPANKNLSTSPTIAITYQFPVPFPSAHLGVDDEKEGAAAAEDELGVVGALEEVDLAGEVPHLKPDERRVGHVVLHDLIGGLEKERLGRRHLVEHHPLNGRLAAPEGMDSGLGES